MFYIPVENKWICQYCTLKNLYLLENGFKFHRKSRYLFKLPKDIIDKLGYNFEHYIYSEGIKLNELDIEILGSKYPSEYKINEFLSVKLENNKTYIYVQGKKFLQCKYLLLNIKPEILYDIDKFSSIDELYNESTIRYQTVNEIIYPDEEFWGHCSNLQAWYENNYDSRLLHHNMAFPLLKELTEAGDPIAKKVFKEEIAKRYKSGYPSVVKYLEKEGYLDYLSKEELDALKQM